MYDNLQKTKSDDKILKNYTDLVNIAKQEIEVDNVYEKFFSLEEGETVVDIGAHIGIFTKKAVAKGCKVYSLEPDPMFFEELKKIEGTTPVKVAISNKNGEAFISSDGNPNAINNEGGESIRTQTFASFLEEFKLEKIDFLKLDCEGGEYDIFTEENIQWLAKNCKKITGELHIRGEDTRLKIPLFLHYFEKYGINYQFTSVDGVLISKEALLSKLDYYQEVLFYCTSGEVVKVVPSINMHYVGGCYVSILDGMGKYKVVFLNDDTKEILHETVIAVNEWTKCKFEYYINWRVLIASEDGQALLDLPMSLKDQRVLVSIDTKGLGDNLAWMPYIEEFRKKHKCKMICSTFNNNLFEENYKKITFVDKTEIVPHIMAQYNIGWFYDKDNPAIIDRFYHPYDPKGQPMQKTASDILGLEYKEIRPKLKLPKVAKNNKVLIAQHSTTQAKYWNNPTGWQEVVDYIKESKHIPMLISKEGNGYMGNESPRGATQLMPGNLESLIVEMCKAKLFIGIGSGLSWLAWACKIPVILISGFSEDYTEMSDCVRIGTPKGLCKGCFNTHKLDAGDWGWCPIHKGSEREFECTKSITGKEVITAIQKFGI